MTKCFLHVDLDAFFASVEQLDNPQYKGLPVIVGGLPNDKRSVVSTCSYEARKYGVHSAMPTAKAYKLCPSGIYLRGRMERYHEKSKEVMNLFYNYSPDVRQMSIDEAFIDISGTEMLFGSPLETAKKLKKEVFEKTGLTVSVGIASNKYIAKIASGLNKPDGLCYVPSGEEENFMLSLPLSKLWGAGTKTQEKIKSFGFYTTKDIHNTPLSSLIVFFGSCTGTFLYNAVRGKEVETFSEETKSHSISAEETYSYDLTDIFTIETALLKLCYEVRFRLLDEGWHTKTLHVKIRYEDFSTVSVQSTFQRAISSVEDMYEKVCTLFKNKYDFGKGIRLLGVGAFNLEKGIKSHVNELFDFGEEKKQKIEEAVLKCQKKNPKTEIKKARQLIKNGFFALCLCLSFFMHGKIYGETSIEKESEFYAEGNWEISLKETVSLNINKNEVSLDFLPLIFNQKAALSCFFMYDKKWYFEAIFQDGFEDNQIIAGYKNQFDNGFYAEAKIGNKDIFMTSDYGTEKLGKGFSGENQVNFGVKFFSEKKYSDTKKIQTEFIIHYDNLKNYTKTWTGLYLKQPKIVELTSYIENKYFNFPFNQNLLTNSIYTKNDRGNFVKNQDFLIYPAKNQIEFKYQLEKETAILINDKVQVENQLLTYIKYLKSWFSELSLTDFLAFLGIDANLASIEELTTNHLETFFTKINNQDALYIKKPGYFSIFENKNVFDVNLLSIKDIENIEIISRTAQNPISNLKITYSINQDNKLVLSYDEKINFEATTDEKYQYLIKNLFPLGKQVPLLYFLGKSINYSNLDYALSFNSFILENTYNIGTKAVPGSVTAYVNGILRPCTYDKNSGKVDFLDKPNQDDNVQIFWQEYSKENAFPNIFTAAGFLFQLNQNFNIKTLLSYSSPIYFPFTNDTQNFGLEENFQSNFLTSVSFEYKNDFENSSLKAENTTGLEFVNYDITDKYTVFTAKNDFTNKKAYFEKDSIIQGNGEVIKLQNGKYEIVFDLEENIKSSETTFNLPASSNLLYESEGFYLDAKISNIDIFQYYNIYLEIGNFEEVPAKWQIKQSQGMNESFSSIYFEISDLQKSRLGNEFTGKIIFEKIDPTLENTISGTLSLRSIEYVKKDFVADSGIKILNHIYFGENAEKIQIENLDQNDTKKIKKYLSPIPINNYEEICFSVYIPDTTNQGSLEIKLLDYENQVILSKNLDFSETEKNQWTKISIKTKDFETKQINPTILQIDFINNTQNPINILLYLKDITLNNAKTSLLFSNIFDFDYQFLENIFVKTSFSGYKNLQNENEVFSGNLLNDIKIRYGSFEIGNQINTNYSLGNSKSIDFSRISHSINTTKNLFDILSISEDFSYIPTKKSINKSNEIKFDFSSFSSFPIIFDFFSNIKNQDDKNTNSIFVMENYNINTNLNLSNYSFDLKFGFNEKSNNTYKSNRNLFDDNYFLSYLNALYYQFDFFEIDSTERKEDFALNQIIKTNFYSFNPTINFSGENSFFETGTNSSVQNLGYSILLPFYFKGHNFSYKYEEKASSVSFQNIQENNLKPKNIFQDIENYFSNEVLFKLLIPGFQVKNQIVDLLANSKLQDGASKSYGTELSWSRNIFASFWDFFIPSGISLNYSKNYKASKVNLLETSNFSAKATFSAFNLFGKNSLLNLFDWYTQDEFVGSFSVSKTDNKWNFTFYNGINLYSSNNNIIQNNLEIKWNLKKDFSLFENIAWSRSGKTTLLVSIIKLFDNDFIPAKIVRFNSFGLSFIKNLQDFSVNQTYDANHKVQVFINEIASVNTNFSFLYNIKDQSQKIELSLTISGKLSF